MNVSLSILNNVDEGRLTRFLKDNGCEYLKDEAGMSIKYWIAKMIEEKRLKTCDLNKYLLDEIFFGMHRSINIYKIKGIRRLQNIELWCSNFFNEFGIEKVPFNNILGTAVNRDDTEKIAAVDYIENDNGEIEKLRILFIENTGYVYQSSISYTFSYIPVEIDLKLKIMIIKARPRNRILPGNKPQEFQEKIYEKLKKMMDIEIIPFNIGQHIEHQETLYNMSKNIMEELFTNIKGYSDISNMQDNINNFTKQVLDNIELDNVEYINDSKSINKEIMDIPYELNNMLQNLIISDYFFNRDEDDIWSTGIKTIITCIRFNDTKNATARLSGENRSKHIFNSKAFMDLRNSLELVKNVTSLSIAYKKDRGCMKVKYEADLDDCLKILILSHRNYNENDFATIWGMYNKNEKGTFRTVSGICKEEVS